MKQQTYISYLIDKEGHILDFERWSCKRISTVINKSKNYYNNCPSFYRKKVNQAVYLTIYATPDGSSKEINPTKILMSEIIEA